jgi:hypothetical protein
MAICQLLLERVDDDLLRPGERRSQHQGNQTSCTFIEQLFDSERRRAC